MRTAALTAVLSGAAAITYSAEAAVLFARMTIAPSATRKGQIDTLIRALKTAGVWTKMDVFRVHAAHDAQAARLNWASTSYDAAAVNSPTFTTDRGYTGDGATSYLDSGFNPATAGGLFAQDKAHMGVWCGTDVTASVQIDVGNSRSRINSRSAGNAAIAGNTITGSNVLLPAATSVGHTCWSRTISTEFETSKNGTVLTSSAVASAALNSLPYYELAIAAAGPAAGNFSTRRVQATHWGSDLTAAERTAVYDALAAYMTAVGA